MEQSKSTFTNESLHISYLQTEKLNAFIQHKAALFL